MTPWLPTAPADEFSDETVSAFLAAGHRESNTHDYKVGPTERIARSISAFANTHGGIVIVGVPDKWDGDLSELEDIDAATEDRLVDSLVDDLDPPHLPEVLRFTVAGKRILILRVDPAAVPRPMFAKHVAHLRRERRSVPANSHDLRGLYERSLPPSIHQPLPQQRALQDLGTQSRLLPDGTNVDFGLRVSGGLGVLPGTISATKLRAPLRDAISIGLSASRASEWAGNFAAVHELTTSGWFHSAPSGPTVGSLLLRFDTAGRGRTKPRGGVHVQVDLLTLGSPSGGGVGVTTTALLAVRDLRSDRSVATSGVIKQGELDRFAPRLDPTELGLIFDMALQTTAHAGELLEELLLDQPAARHIPAAGSLVGDLDGTLNFDDLPYPRPDHGQLGMQRTFDAPAQMPTDSDQRAAVVNDWLDTLLMAIGYVPNADIWP